MRRRCLVFEMGGARRKHLEESSGSGSGSSLWLNSDGTTPSDDQNLSPLNTGNESSRCLLPGIGLHLNALATTPKDYKFVNPDSSSASARLVIGPSSVIHLNPSATSQELLDNILPQASSERDIDSMENTALLVEDACPVSGFTANEEINQGSPKKKRYFLFLLLSNPFFFSRVIRSIFLCTSFELIVGIGIVRRRAEQAGEGEACKRCNCKRSKCLKL